MFADEDLHQGSPVMPLQASEWLALFHLPGLGSRQLSALVEQSPAWPQGWLSALSAESASALRLWLDHPSRSPLTARVEADLAWLGDGPDRHLLHPGHFAWPWLLDEIADSPLMLWALGDLDALVPPKLAMVGSRRPTREGLGNATTFARELAVRGWSIVSGMALGIDGTAQEAALEAGGKSVGVLACGVDVVYPPRHHRLHERLQASGGLLVSEHPPGTRARSGFFPRRNRIVTGLSLGVLVVEAAERSGSLISARLATEQNREVFALPGSLHNPQARGCLQLIRQGAVLVRDVDDILHELVQWASTPVATTAPSRPDAAPETAAESDALLRWLSSSPTPVDSLVGLSGLGVIECQRRLLELELEGRVTQTMGGWIRLPIP